MMKECWINLPVKDPVRSEAFYTAIGFSVHKPANEEDPSVGIAAGTNGVIFMLFPEEMFEHVTRHRVSDGQLSSEVLFSLGADSKEEVDRLIEKAEQAGGRIFSGPQEQGWMYGAGFSDPDGHRWNVLYMEMDQS